MLDSWMTDGWAGRPVRACPIINDVHMAMW